MCNVNSLCCLPNMQPTFIVLFFFLESWFRLLYYRLSSCYQKYHLSSQSSEVQSLGQWHDSNTPRWRVHCESILSHFGRRRGVWQEEDIWLYYAEAAEFSSFSSPTYSSCRWRSGKCTRLPGVDGKNLSRISWFKNCWTFCIVTEILYKTLLCFVC